MPEYMDFLHMRYFLESQPTKAASWGKSSGQPLTVYSLAITSVDTEDGIRACTSFDQPLNLF